MNILNLTQHPATAEQAAAGVFNLTADDQKLVSDLMTFSDPPDATELMDRAELLAKVAEEYEVKLVMIGGPQWLMTALEGALSDLWMQAVYPFTRPDGHVTFVEALN